MKSTKSCGSDSQSHDSGRYGSCISALPVLFQRTAAPADVWVLDTQHRQICVPLTAFGHSPFAKWLESRSLSSSHAVSVKILNFFIECLFTMPIVLF